MVRESVLTLEFYLSSIPSTRFCHSYSSFSIYCHDILFKDPRSNPNYRSENNTKTMQREDDNLVGIIDNVVEFFVVQFVAFEPAILPLLS